MRMDVRNFQAKFSLLGLLGLACLLPRFSAFAQTVEYIHTDALGTPIAVTNASRVVIERSEYEPYGKLLNRPLTDGPGFTGHVQDAATGMTYMQQRYYDPGIGRFLSVDPVTANSSTGANFNRYWYANNSPYKFIDPDGREAGCMYGPSMCGLRETSPEVRAQQAAMVSGLATFIPGVDLANCGRNGCSRAGWAMASIGIIPGEGKGIQLGLRALNTAADAVAIFRSISRVAFKAADKVGDFKLSAKHLPGAGGNYVKFGEGVDIKASITEALRSDGAKFFPNGDSTKSFIVVTDLGRQVGSKGETSLKVVVGTDGKIWTAYPTKAK